MSVVNINKLVVGVLIVALAACSSHKKIETDDEFSVDANSAQESAGASIDGDLALDGPEEVSLDQKKPAITNNEGLSLEKELNGLDSEPAVAKNESQQKNNTELTLDEPVGNVEAKATQTQETVKAQEPEQAAIPAPVINSTVESSVTAPTPEPVPEPVMKLAKIDNVIYQGNSNGGAVVVSADQELKFTKRFNSTTNQFIVEIENSIVPKKFKRALNTKDMASSIGSVDIYQKAGSNISRFVVQLRAGAPEPIVQPEGNSLLIIGAAITNSAPLKPVLNSEKNSTSDVSSQKTQDENNSTVAPSNEVVDMSQAGIMSSDNLEEFLISNNKFYGKKISIETNKIEINDAIKFLAEESGVNIIIDESVTGNLSLKLKSVPWDQALILILKSKRLGFKRQGTVLRIGRVEDFQKDEQEALNLKGLRKAKEPLVVKRFFIGYADIAELEKKISEYLTSIDVESHADPAAASGPVGAQTGAGANNKTMTVKKEVIGKVIGDKRTNSLIVTDTEENMKRIEQLITALDSQPQQVLIEGKVIEAKESFTIGMGINWNSTPVDATTANRSRIAINPALDAGLAVFDSSFQWGNLDILGSLSARLQLGEREDKVRVLSSPRIAVLSNQTASIAQTVGLLVPESSTPATGGGAPTTSLKVVPVGVTLNVTPLVSNEGTVTLDLDIKRSFLATVDGTTTEDRSAKTKVIVRSGQTAVIGGIFESENRTSNSGVPGFKDIPILGRMFKSDRDAKSKNELVIFVTPTILKPVVGHGKKSTEL